MALALGRTVRELEQTLSHAEYIEWRAFYGLDPWGEQRADQRAAQLTAAVLAPYSKGTPKPKSFLLYPEERLIPQEDLWRAKLRRLAPDE